MSILDSCNHLFAIHGLAVEVSCAVPSLNLPLHNALSEFGVSDFPDGFSSSVGLIRHYEESVVLRHLSPLATTYPGNHATEIYEHGERFWLVDDRWGLCEMNLLKGQFQSWILPQAAADPARIVQEAVLWPLAQLLRGKGLTLVQGVSIERDGWGLLLLSPLNLEPELSHLIKNGWRVIGQQWTALREEDNRVAMLSMPGAVEREIAPQLAGGEIAVASSAAPTWVDLTAETPQASRKHAFCDAVAIVSNTRRPIPAMRQINRSGALAALRAGWPIPELHPQRRPGSIPLRLANQCICFDAQLSRRPEEFVQLLDQTQSHHARPAIVPEVTVMAALQRPKIPA